MGVGVVVRLEEAVLVGVGLSVAVEVRVGEAVAVGVAAEDRG